jgi:Fe-S cluster biosynthesis and repair protein YggX
MNNLRRTVLLKKEVSTQTFKKKPGNANNQMVNNVSSKNGRAQWDILLESLKLSHSYFTLMMVNKNDKILREQHYSNKPVEADYK